MEPPLARLLAPQVYGGAVRADKRLGEEQDGGPPRQGHAGQGRHPEAPRAARGGGARTANRPQQGQEPPGPFVFFRFRFFRVRCCLFFFLSSMLAWFLIFVDVWVRRRAQARARAPGLKEAMNRFWGTLWGLYRVTRAVLFGSCVQGSSRGERASHGAWSVAHRRR